MFLYDCVLTVCVKMYSLVSAYCSMCERMRYRHNERAPRHLENSPMKTQLDVQKALHLSLSPLFSPASSGPPLTIFDISL